MTALIIITDGTITIVIVESMARCLIMARYVAHLGLVACGGAGAAI